MPFAYKTRNLIKKQLFLLGAALATFLLIYFAVRNGAFFEAMERGIQSSFFYFREPTIKEVNPYVSDRVHMVGFNEESITMIGRWPWKRYVHAEFLHKLEQFSPETVMLDLLFIKRETVPTFLSDKLGLNDEALGEFQSAFADMDNELASAFRSYRNVFIDVQLIAASRDDLPPDYLERIRFCEKEIAKYALPADQEMSGFKSMEPVLEEYIQNAHPVVINVPIDDDGKIRAWALYYPYEMSDGSIINVPTAVLQLLMHYYRVPKADVLIEYGRVTLKNAIVPVVNRETGQETQERIELTALRKLISNPTAPEEYRFNDNLFNFMVNDHMVGVKTENRIPFFPLPVLERADGTLEILDSWEVYAAAEKADSRQVSIVRHKRKDLVIRAPRGNAYLINYAGRESRTFDDLAAGTKRIHYTIPTSAYKDVYFMESPPDLPALNADGSINTNSYDMSWLEGWFYGFCREKGYEVYREAVRTLGSEPDNEELVKFVQAFQEERKYLLYVQYLSQFDEIQPGMFRELIAQYPEFGAALGQSPEYYLSERQMVNAVMQFYREHFEKYYNKLVFAGGNALGIGDVQQTPYSSMFGINVIINALNTVITENQFSSGLESGNLDTWLLLGLCLVAGLIYMWAPVKISPLLAGLSSICIFTASAIMFCLHNFIIASSPLLFANIIIFIQVISFKLMTEEKDRKFLKATFGTYLAPELIDEMYKAGKRPELGGETRSITAYFTDIQGFSTFSEKLTPQQLVLLLNEYLSNKTDILLSHRGTLDKYEGDAIIAFIGAPMEVPDHALRACRIALEMQAGLEMLKAKWREEQEIPDMDYGNVKKLPPDEWEPGKRWPNIVHNMRMRIGINTGDIVVGNMGSKVRMNYTMMGDAVNLAARLEAAAKQYGVYTVASEYTLASTFIDDTDSEVMVRDLVEARFIDYVTVVGKSEPVRIYELCALKGELNERDQLLFKHFYNALTCYLSMHWDQAIQLFEKAQDHERYPDQELTPSKLYISRCKNFKLNPPADSPLDWDGVFRLTSK